MSVIIDRIAITDDDGSGTYGTAINDAFMDALYDDIDGALAALMPKNEDANTNGDRQLDIKNSSTGASVRAIVKLTAGAVAHFLIAYGSGNTSGISGGGGEVALIGAGVGGVSIQATHGSGALRFTAAGSTMKAKLETTGHFYTDDGNVYSLSDLRYKTRVGDFARGLAEILQLTPAIYQHREGSGLPTTEGPFASLGAQDVQAVIPEAVTENADGRLGLAVGPLVFALINATKELTARVATLEEEIVNLTRA